MRSHPEADHDLHFLSLFVILWLFGLRLKRSFNFVKMVNFKNIAASLAVASIFGGAVAHPGEVHTDEEIKRELASYRVASNKASRSLARVADSPAALSLKARAVARRAATAQALREKRGLTNRK
jgi:hypothetical protein